MQPMNSRIRGLKGGWGDSPPWLCPLGPMSVMTDEGMVDGTMSRLIRFKILGPGPVTSVSARAG